MITVLRERVAALESAFAEIARTRMVGVAVVHESVRVQAVDFGAIDTETALGVLVTPWFMNLVRLPLARSERRDVGAKATHDVGSYNIEFTSAYEPVVGAFESCSLYSPLTAFVDHDAALATAREVMRTLTAAPMSAQLVPQSQALSRRAVLFGARQSRAR